MPIQYNHDHDNEVTLFAETNFRNQRRRFGIRTDDRRRHVYVIGKTGMGKTTLMENFMLSDVNAGHGCCYIDPHGDTAEKLVDFIPSNRINDVVYFNPADIDFPMGFNILETDNEEQKPLVASGLMGVFKKIWPDVWSPRMEYILMNCVLALLDYPGATLLGINRLLVDKDYRARVVAKIRDPIVKTFWVAEFSSWSEKYATEAIAPVQNKVGQFLSSSVIRNIVAQVKSTLNLRRIMDDGKILVVNLSKGRIGEDNMRLLGGMLITKIQLAAQERQNIPKESDRRDFYLYVDEFQNFANESFATILSEARKYRLNLIVAHQYIEQLDEKVAAAIFGNVGTIITMRVGAADAEAMETEFGPHILPEDLVNLAKFQIYLKLMVDGVATAPFSANTLGPISKRTNSVDKVIAVSRERYAEPRPIIEEKVLKWSGMELAIPEPGVTTLSPSVPVSTESPEGGIVKLEYPSIKTMDEQEAELIAQDQQARVDFQSQPMPVTAAVQPASSLEVAPDDTTEYLKIHPERMAAIQAAIPQQQGKKKDKPKFPHTCTRCGKVWTLPIQLDPTRPMYCAECRPLVMDEKKRSVDQTKQIRKELPPLSSIPDTEEHEAGFTVSAQAALEKQNRPRIIRSERSKLDEDEIVAAPESMLNEIRKAKGPLNTNKQNLEQLAGQPKRPKPNKPNPSNQNQGPRPGRKDDRRDKRDRPLKTDRPMNDRPKPEVRAPQSTRQADPAPLPQPPADLDLSFDEEPTSSHSVAPGQTIRFDE